MQLTFESELDRVAFLGRLDRAKPVLSYGCSKENYQPFFSPLNMLEAGHIQIAGAAGADSFFNIHAGFIRLVSPHCETMYVIL